ncbi:MAG: low molecular weight protein-tyrosine-phosphatase [Acidimicrobiia bacterium]|nr:low molecular weight protein-tyrosine-phosphatase [Acidimicrobiia bacterium]
MSLAVLAVCAGNICRSPAAAAAIKAEAAAAGLDIVVDSAGTGGWNVGDPPSPAVADAAARRGLVVEGRARRVIPADFGRFDIVVAMDRANLRDLQEIAPTLEARAKVRLFRTYDKSTDDDEIPDPFGGTEADYDRAISQIMASASGMVDELAAVAGA